MSILEAFTRHFYSVVQIGIFIYSQMVFNKCTTFLYDVKLWSDLSMALEVDDLIKKLTFEKFKF